MVSVPLMNMLDSSENTTMVNQFTQSQKERIIKFSELRFPQIGGPLWLLSLLDAILPQSCPFHKAYWVRGWLILYIPVLCRLNPFYDALYEHRTKVIVPIEKL
jgi:hypothetical protein